MNMPGGSRSCFANYTMFNNFKFSLASGIKMETPNSIFMPISYHFYANVSQTHLSQVMNTLALIERFHNLGLCQAMSTYGRQ